MDGAKAVLCIWCIMEGVKMRKGIPLSQKVRAHRRRVSRKGKLENIYLLKKANFIDVSDDRGLNSCGWVLFLSMASLFLL